LQAGTDYVGCAFHYESNTMRDVIVVSANATPGPQGRAAMRMQRACALLAMLLALGSAPAWGGTVAPAGLPLIDQNGATFTLNGLRGTPVAVTFIATRCTDACPIIDGLFSKLSMAIAQKHVAAKLVTITLDPDFDRPIVMRRTAEAFSADARRWRFASGKPRDIRAIMHAFGVTTELDEHGVPDVHSTFVYVFDARGRLVRTLPVSTNLPDEVLGLVQSRVVAR
jgi:cytochrome oxidase Cu insertion factor (SCO1/SenC/PrrC family)